jgi:hypothetical protein
MSLKSIIKVANYYNFKYGFDKVAGSILRDKFKEFEKYLEDQIESVNLKYDVFPNYIEGIKNIFEGFGLSDVDMNILKNKANATASDKTSKFHGSDPYSVYRLNERKKADEDYRNLKRKLLGKIDIEESPLEDRVKRYKIERLEFEKRKLLNSMEESGDFTDYNKIAEIEDKIRELKNLPSISDKNEFTPLDEFIF